MPNIAAKTPSNEKTIAAGAGDIFCKLYVCNKKAIPLDKYPHIKLRMSLLKNFKRWVFQIKHWTNQN